MTRTDLERHGRDLLSAAAAATPVPLYEDSHFRLYGKCFIEQEGQAVGAVYIATKQNGAIFDSEEDELSGRPPEGLPRHQHRGGIREVMKKRNPNASRKRDFGATAADGYRSWASQSR